MRLIISGLTTYDDRLLSVQSHYISKNSEVSTGAGIYFAMTNPRMNTMGRGIARSGAVGENRNPIDGITVVTRIGKIPTKPIFIMRCFVILP